MQERFQQTDPAGCSECMNQDIGMQSNDTGAGDKNILGSICDLSGTEPGLPSMERLVSTQLFLAKNIYLATLPCVLLLNLAMDTETFS